MHKSTRFDFDSVADFYDGWYDTLDGKRYDLLEKKAVLEFLKDGKYKKLLDIGCGTGHWDLFFSQLGYRVYGLDISRQMVNSSKEKIKENATFFVADGSMLPIRSGVFDVVTMITSLEFIKDTESVISQAMQCLKKPGGRLIIGTLNSKSRLNRKRIHRKEKPYSEASLFSPDKLKKIIEPIGKIKMKIAVYVLPIKSHFFLLENIFDSIAQFFRLKSGDFIVIEVKL